MGMVSVGVIVGMLQQQVIHPCLIVHRNFWYEGNFVQGGAIATVIVDAVQDLLKVQDDLGRARLEWYRNRREEVTKAP